ncbi:hypothetical protein Ddye_023070 [Dipteronia dyeriana]|uniref:Disease resistance protein At4g27190-like leucine-rich repeats domain-containing protein n=1 Tax=Dipteronia dyeriana TaxID=168575 RepID=A0AAD9TSR1_9ROSI|nr:hypothetical protein Ddye_023070 [Dipteronia dyeriana]
MVTGAVKVVTGAVKIVTGAVAFPCLKELILRELPELLHLWKEDSLPSMVFENLTNLEVSVFEKLKTLVPSSVSFKTLMTVTVWRCNGLMNLFTLSTAKTLVQLVRMNILDCKRMEKIITDMGDEETISGKGEKDAAINKITFSMLNFIKLWDLPNLTSLYSGSFTLECPSPTTISIANCPKMNKFVSPNTKDLVIQSASPFSEKVVWHKQPLAMSSCFQNTTVLSMHGCDALKYLFPYSMVESLAQLNVLEICDCKFMKEVIVVEEENISTTLFPNLNRLKLKDLPELMILCNFTGNLIELPSLSHLWIANCPNMNTFICNSTSANMSASKELLEEMKSEKSLHTNIQPLFQEKVNLPCLKTLKIEDMGNLRKIWHDQPNLNSFCLLECLIVHNCSNLLIVCPSNILGRLQKLELLVVSNCESIEEVFEFQALSGGKTDAITNQLRKLDLYNMPKLKHVWKMGSKDVVSFKNLLSIRVSQCQSLKSLIPASIARQLGELQELRISKCQVEEVVGKEEE